MCSSNPDWLTPPGAQIGRLIEAGVSRQQVAIIYDVGLSTCTESFRLGIGKGAAVTLSAITGCGKLAIVR